MILHKKVEETIQRILAGTGDADFSDQTRKCVRLLCDCFEKGGKVLLCGNGGSCADCDHIVGELMKGFLKRRPIDGALEEALKIQYGEKWDEVKPTLQRGLPAISLCAHQALFTAFTNDMAASMVFAQQVLGYGNKHDVLIAMSTSGRSANVIHAVKAAKALGMKVVGFTGASSGELSALADICFEAPSFDTYRIQEYHVVLYHAVCAAVEAYFFDE